MKTRGRKLTTQINRSTDRFVDKCIEERIGYSTTNKSIKAKSKLYCRTRKPCWFYDKERGATFIMWLYKIGVNGKAYLLDLADIWGDTPLRCVERKFIPMKSVPFAIPKADIQKAWNHFHKMKE